MKIILKILSIFVAFGNLAQTQNADVHDIIHFSVMGDLEFFFRNEIPGIQDCYNLIKDDYKETSKIVVSTAVYDADSFTRLVNKGYQTPAEFAAINIKNLGNSIIEYQNEIEKSINDAEKAKNILLKYKSTIGDWYLKYQKGLNGLIKSPGHYNIVKDRVDGSMNNIVLDGKRNTAKLLKCMKKKYCEISS